MMIIVKYWQLMKWSDEPSSLDSKKPLSRSFRSRKQAVSVGMDDCNKSLFAVNYDDGDIHDSQANM